MPFFISHLSQILKLYTINKDFGVKKNDRPSHKIIYKKKKWLWGQEKGQAKTLKKYTQ
jgi:hypothetical protein